MGSSIQENSNYCFSESIPKLPRILGKFVWREPVQTIAGSLLTHVDDASHTKNNKGSYIWSFPVPTCVNGDGQKFPYLRI